MPATFYFRRDPSQNILKEDGDSNTIYEIIPAYDSHLCHSKRLYRLDPNGKRKKIGTT